MIAPLPVNCDQKTSGVIDLILFVESFASATNKRQNYDDKPIKMANDLPKRPK